MWLHLSAQDLLPTTDRLIIKTEMLRKTCKSTREHMHKDPAFQKLQNYQSKYAGRKIQKQNKQKNTTSIYVYINYFPIILYML